MKIKRIIAREILDSRASPTIEVRMEDEDGAEAVFAVPSGASTGRNEALELRDGGKRYGGLGVGKNIRIINTKLASEFRHFALDRQEDFDLRLIELDDTDNKAHLGANTSLALSGAYLKLGAAAARLPLWQYISQLYGFEPSFPRLYANLVNGGRHAPGLDIQEFIVVINDTRPSRAIEELVRFSQELKKRLAEQNPHSITIGDEGGFVPLGISSVQVLQLFDDISSKMQLKADFALDVAASSFFDGQHYLFAGQKRQAHDLMSFYSQLDEAFKILSIEDPFAEEDIASHIALNKTQPKFFIVGDDTTVTDARRIDALAGEQAIGGVIIKPNQAGTITEALYAIRAARRHHLKTIISHRSGETNDDLIADLAYGVGAFGLKLGAPARGERIAKYNRLLMIEQESRSA